MHIIILIIFITIWAYVLDSIEPTPINYILNTIISFVSVFAMSWYAISSSYIEDAFKQWYKSHWHMAPEVSSHEEKAESLNFYLTTFEIELRERRRKGETIPPDIEQNIRSAEPEQFFRNAEYLGYTIQLKRDKTPTTNPDPRP